MLGIGGLVRRLVTVARVPKSRGRGVAITGPQVTESGGDGIDQKLDQFFADHGRLSTNNSEFTKSPPGDYKTYLKISEHPTLKLATVKRKAPIKINPWGWRGADSGVPDSWVQWAKSTFDPLRSSILNIAFDAWTFGWSPSEIIRDAAWNVTGFKKLAQSRTEYLALEDGDIVGLRNIDANGNAVDLPIESCFVYVNDPIRGGPYGCSIYESARSSGVWWNWIQIAERNGRYICKIAGVIWVIYYPVGTSRNAAGVEYPNEWLARRLQADLALGGNIRIPNKYASMVSPGANAIETAATIGKALDKAGLSDWKVDCYHPEGADFTEGFIRDMQYFDENMVRSVELPDRSVLPSQRGQAGSHADSSMHDNTADMVSQLDYSNICQQFRAQVVDRSASAKFGAAAVGRILCEEPPLSVENSDSIIKILTAMATNADVGPELYAVMDVEAALDDIHFPVLDAARGTISARLLAVANQNRKIKQSLDQHEPPNGENGNRRIIQSEK